MADSTRYPLPFVPHHQSPETPGENPILFAFRGRDLLVTNDLNLPSVEEIDSQGVEAVRTQYLGRLGERHCYSAELPHDAQAETGFRFADLRMLFATLDEMIHTLAGRAVQIVEWDRTHQYCGVCAEPTQLSEADRSRSCPKCKIPTYPRLAPAMIVAVEKGDQILLARSPHFPAGIMSVLAGFVEPGESAEEAVMREVFEETSIIVKNVEYFFEPGLALSELSHARIPGRIRFGRDRDRRRGNRRGRLVRGGRDAYRLPGQDQYLAVADSRFPRAERAARP